MRKRGLIVLDRDGVLNEMVIHAEFGTIDSPLNPDEVRLFSWVPDCLNRLTKLGYALAIATNQPAFAKGKTTKLLLEGVHQKILNMAQNAGGVIAHSFICWHRSEDHCKCRKPKPTMIFDAISAAQLSAEAEIWMVGDGLTDIQAGKAAGVKTAFLGNSKCDTCKVFVSLDLKPDFIGTTLFDFVTFLEK